MTGGFERFRPEVNPYRTVFNHVGLCVADRERSRRFYEDLLGFEFWWELEPPDDGTDQLLQSAMIRDPDGQLIELLADSWLAVLPPRP
jgi:hypothetical protein